MLVFSSMVDAQIVSSVAGASNSDTSYDDFPQLLQSIERFESKRELAQGKFVDAIDRTIAAVERDRTLSEDAKRTQVDDLKHAKDNFLSRESLPTSDALISLTTAYLDALYDKEAAKVASSFSQLRQKHKEQAEDLANLDVLEHRWIVSLPTGMSFERNGDWHGRRTLSNGGKIDCNFHIRKYENGLIGGSIWWNNRSTAQQGIEVTGRYYGNQIILETVQTLKGGPHHHRMIGYHIGDRIILHVSYPGQPNGGFVDFRLARTL
ncbi:MAG: hypothetical protein R3C18_18130 [Planctomycetaceae bacterium]